MKALNSLLWLWTGLALRPAEVALLDEGGGRLRASRKACKAGSNSTPPAEAKEPSIKGWAEAPCEAPLSEVERQTRGRGPIRIGLIIGWWELAVPGRLFPVRKAINSSRRM